MPVVFDGAEIQPYGSELLPLRQVGVDGFSTQGLTQDSKGLYDLFLPIDQRLQIITEDATPAIAENRLNHVTTQVLRELNEFFMDPRAADVTRALLKQAIILDTLELEKDGFGASFDSLRRHYLNGLIRVKVVTMTAPFVLGLESLGAIRGIGDSSDLDRQGFLGQSMSEWTGHLDTASKWPEVLAGIKSNKWPKKFESVADSLLVCLNTAVSPKNGAGIRNLGTLLVGSVYDIDETYLAVLSASGPFTPADIVPKKVAAQPREKIEVITPRQVVMDDEPALTHLNTLGIDRYSGKRLRSHPMQDFLKRGGKIVLGAVSEKANNERSFEGFSENAGMAAAFLDTLVNVPEAELATYLQKITDWLQTSPELLKSTTITAEIKREIDARLSTITACTSSNFILVARGNVTSGDQKTRTTLDRLAILSARVHTAV